MLGNSSLKGCRDCLSNRLKYSSESIRNMALATSHNSFALAIKPASSISSLLSVWEIKPSHSIFHLDNARCKGVKFCWIIRLAKAENITRCSPDQELACSRILGRGSLESDHEPDMTIKSPNTPMLLKTGLLGPSQAPSMRRSITSRREGKCGVFTSDDD